jgi:hypothetical protein
MAPSKREKPAAGPRKADKTDYDHRARVNLVAGVAIAVLLAVIWVSVKMFTDEEKLQDCVSSGRKTCIDLGTKPRDGVFIPTR